MSTHQDAILGWIVNHHHTVAPIRQPVTASRYSETYLASATTIVESQNLCGVISSNAFATQLTALTAGGMRDEGAPRA